MTSIGTSTCQLKLVDFTMHRVVTAPFDLVKTLGYDLILGRDLLCQLDIRLDFASHTVSSEDLILGRDLLCQLDIRLDFASHTVSSEDLTIPLTLQEFEYRVMRILDADYTPPNLDAMLPQELENEERAQLHEVLERHRPAFNKALGNFKAEPYHIPVEPNAKPFFGKPYPIPVIHRDTVRAGVKRPLSLGGIEPDVDSPWVSSYQRIMAKFDW
ncbi:TPA: hypothetical protein N0F65_000422 [Lagenidium giganteum]|uniref:Uncharacterized protein n=1 Tax=Lagenidium giganteum TaxID=4803 RepID=A0AAV2YJS5_9STRA|nr:TPA: hypothetical protein N0F65_000422 [Lagenidium giganteum]